MQARHSYKIEDIVWNASFSPVRIHTWYLPFFFSAACLHLAFQLLLSCHIFNACLSAAGPHPCAHPHWTPRTAVRRGGRGGRPRRRDRLHALPRDQVGLPHAHHVLRRAHPGPLPDIWRQPVSAAAGCVR